LSFTIPNEAQTNFTDLAEPDSIDIDILVTAYSGTGVISGCAVTAQGTPDMTVAVASGTVVVGGTRATVTGGNVTITTADANNPRIDLVVVNSSGTKSVTAGTPAVGPVMPAIPSTSTVLAIVYVPTNDGTIESTQIIDKRVVNAIPVGQLDNGTDGELITWNTSGVPTTVAVGTVNYALISGGTGVAPTFQIVPVAGGGTGVATSTGTGSVVLSNSPTLVTPALGTPASGVMTNVSGTASSLTAGTVTTNANLTGHVTSSGNAAVLGSFTSAQLATALTNETGSGLVVFGTSPTLITPALGTPASGVMTNVTGTAASLTAGNVTTNANLTGGVTSSGNAATVITNANLTGGVTSVGNAATVITNANLTGVVTSTGNATAIAAKALAVSKLADGTDGELITWDASGVAATVAVGTATHVLTSNGVGVAPTFQEASGGGVPNPFFFA